MISCEKASTICNKIQYNESTLIDKIKLRYHLFMCKTCSAFTKQNTELTTLCDKANLQGLSEQDKAKMNELFQNKS